MTHKKYVRERGLIADRSSPHDSLTVLLLVFIHFEKVNKHFPLIEITPT